MNAGNATLGACARSAIPATAGGTIRGAARCRRDTLPLVNQLCRGCRLLIAEHGPEIAEHPATQLSLGGPFAFRLHTRAGHLGYQPVKWRARQRARARRPPPPPVSEHLVDPHQNTLLELPRDWHPIAETEDLPSLTPAAQQLIEQFRLHAFAWGWKTDAVYEVSRSLRLLLGWVGIDAPIPERDIRSLPTMVDNTTAPRVLLFLDQHGLVARDPERLIDPHQRWIESKIAALPEEVADELRRWVRVLRGEGRRPHPARSFEVIRDYLSYAYPTLQSWVRRFSSLREITPDDVAAALTGKAGTPAQGLRTGLRSIFRALKQERLVFRDPTKTLSLATVENLPTTLSSDQLRGLLERTEGAMARLMVALVAIHAIGVDDLRRLRLADLDMPRGQLRARRRIIYLDEITHELARAWLQERHRLWPDTSNPHLMITASSAYATPPGPIAAATINRIFRPTRAPALRAAAGPDTRRGTGNR